MTVCIAIGLLPFYAVLVLAYIAGIGLYAHRVWLTISKGGPMHEVSVCVSSQPIAVTPYFLLGVEYVVSCHGSAHAGCYPNAHAPLEVLCKWKRHTLV